MKYLKGPIRFDDGRTGEQYVTVDDDGSRTLTGVLVTRRADGEYARVCYDRRPDLMARVYSLGDLRGSSWSLTGPEVEQ